MSGFSWMALCHSATGALMFQRITRIRHMSTTQAPGYLWTCRLQAEVMGNMRRGHPCHTSAQQAPGHIYDFAYAPAASRAAALLVCKHVPTSRCTCRSGDSYDSRYINRWHINRPSTGQVMELRDELQVDDLCWARDGSCLIGWSKVQEDLPPVQYSWAHAPSQEEPQHEACNLQADLPSSTPTDPAHMLPEYICGTAHDGQIWGTAEDAQDQVESGAQYQDLILLDAATGTLGCKRLRLLRPNSPPKPSPCHQMFLWAGRDMAHRLVLIKLIPPAGTAASVAGMAGPSNERSSFAETWQQNAKNSRRDVAGAAVLIDSEQNAGGAEQLNGRLAVQNLASEHPAEVTAGLSGTSGTSQGSANAEQQSEVTAGQSGTSGTNQGSANAEQQSEPLQLDADTPQQVLHEKSASGLSGAPSHASKHTKAGAPAFQAVILDPPDSGLNKSAWSSDSAWFAMWQLERPRDSGSYFVFDGFTSEPCLVTNEPALEHCLAVFSSKDGAVQHSSTWAGISHVGWHPALPHLLMSVKPLPDLTGSTQDQLSSAPLNTAHQDGYRADICADDLEMTSIAAVRAVSMEAADGSGSARIFPPECLDVPDATRSKSIGEYIAVLRAPAWQATWLQAIPGFSGGFAKPALT